MRGGERRIKLKRGESKDLKAASSWSRDPAFKCNTETNGGIELTLIDLEKDEKNHAAGYKTSILPFFEDGGIFKKNEMILIPSQTNLGLKT